jgi:hypothetical protein
MLKFKKVQEVNGYPLTKVGVKNAELQYLPDQTWSVGHKPISLKQYEDIIKKLNLGENPDTGELYNTLNAIQETCWGLAQIEGYEDMALVDTNNAPIDDSVLAEQLKIRLDEVISTNINWVNATWGSVQQRIGNQFDQSKPERKR